ATSSPPHSQQANTVPFCGSHQRPVLLQTPPSFLLRRDSLPHLRRCVPFLSQRLKLRVPLSATPRALPSSSASRCRLLQHDSPAVPSLPAF
ncbi:hypothetical protein S83_028417, partial [Arachis hypogaea]